MKVWERHEASKDWIGGLDAVHICEGHNEVADWIGEMQYDTCHISDLSTGTLTHSDW